MIPLPPLNLGFGDQEGYSSATATGAGVSFGTNNQGINQNTIAIIAIAGVVALYLFKR